MKNLLPLLGTSTLILLSRSLSVAVTLRSFSCQLRHSPLRASSIYGRSLSSLITSPSISNRHHPGTRLFSTPLTTMSSSNALSTHRVTSYNVLSSNLADPSFHRSCKKEYLDQAYRLNLLQQVLDKETKQEAIICLQEISQLWGGALHRFFSQRNYHFITGFYGHKFNGYMGVAVAVPLSKYEIVDADIKKVADNMTVSSFTYITHTYMYIHTYKHTYIYVYV